jgi:glycosyltransferase involved in cell wall biosynthesis
MIVSVIIPTKNRAAALLECLKFVLGQTRLPEELIIVDQSALSQEELIKNRHDFKDLRFIYIWDKEISGLTAARNIGVTKASGDIILFLDDDVILDSAYIAAILDVYDKDSSNTIGGVSGLITNFKFTSPLGSLSKKVCYGPWRNHYDFWYQKGSGLLATHFLSGCNMSFRKEVLAKYKFDEKLRGICMREDQIFSYQVSKEFKLFMTAEARLQHLVSPVSRDSERNLKAMDVFSNYYFFRTYVEKTYLHIAYYLLNTLGSATVALLSGNRERILGTYVALAKVITGRSPLK